MNKKDDLARIRHIQETNDLIEELKRNVYHNELADLLYRKIKLYEKQLKLYDRIMGYSNGKS